MELQSLLKRLRRSCRSSPDVGAGAPSLPQRPPDEGSAALGYQLGSAFASALLGCAPATSSSDINDLRKVGCDIIDALSAAPSSSFAVGYFSGVHMTLCDDQISATALFAALEAILSWCLTWIEQSDPAIRSALIRGFAHLTHLSASEVDPNTLTLADAYSKLKRGIDRRLLVRESVVISFSALRRDVRDGHDSAGTTVVAHLSGLMARCVLLPATDGADCFNRDGSMFWTALLRECRLFVSSTAQSSGLLCANVMTTILPWLVKSFRIYSLRLSWNDGIVVDEAFAMFQQLCDLLCDVSPRRWRGLFEDSQILCPAIEESYSIILGEILCRFSTSGPCIIQLSEAMCSAAIESSSAISKVSDVVVFRLALLALTETSDSKRILESIFQLIRSRCFDECCGKVVVVGSVRALGRTFASVTSHARIAAKLCRIADEIEEEVREEGIGPDKSISPDQIVRLFQSSSSELNSNSMLSKLIVPVTLESTSPTDQMCVFLVASSLLCTKTRNSGGDTEKNFELLQQIVERWPHLGARSIPLATSFIQAAVTQEDCDALVIPALRFLCSAASIDPSCAQQVWSLTSTLTEHPSIVRIASIRTFSLLCKANRKLYGRVRDRLGQYCSSPDTKTRIAATATLCDLAREDLIRDVSDIIGWLQIRLGDEEVIVVHYVLMTLHHLIRAGELDFDLVIKVISKKLVRCDDVFSILELSEALVVLLGDGAQSIDDGSDEDDSCDEDGEVSPQVEVAVSTLLALAKEYKEKIDDDSESALRILNLIYSSLSGYNIGELGVNADALRSLLSCDDPNDPGILPCIGYSSLKSIVMDGLVMHRPEFPDKASNDTKNCPYLEMLAATLLEFEEDTLGPSLWKKQGASKSSPAAKSKKQKLSKSVLGALPSAELLQSLYEDNPSTGTAIARIFCLDHKSTPTSSTDELVDTLSEVLADLNVADMLDPLVMTLYYGAWLEAAKVLWASISSADSGGCNFAEDAVTEVLQQLDGLKEVDHDNSLISLAAFCCIMPEAHQGVDLSSFADQVHESILRAHNDHQFMDRNSAMVAFGLLGCRYSRLLAMDRIGQVIEIIDGSGIETKSFSALMSLALIARSLSASLVSIGKSDVASSVALKMIGRILALIVDDLHLCFGASVPAILTLIASLKTGKASPDLLESLHEIEDDTFLETDKTNLKMKGIFVVLSVALPAFDMLVSQIECRRHSGSNRSEFISLSLQIAKYPPPTFWSLFRGRSTATRGLDRFMEATSYFIANWPSGVVAETLENLWAICAFNMFEHATSFLNSLCAALRRYNAMDHSRTASERKSNRTNTNLFSPTALKSIHKLLTGTILMNLAPYVSGSGQAENRNGNATAGAWSSYLACLEQIPASALNDANFFILASNQGGDFDEAIARMLIIAYLAKSSGEYFGSETDKFLMKAQLWIARQRVTSLTKEQLKSIRLAMLHLGRGGITPNNETSSQDCRKELIFHIRLFAALAEENLYRTESLVPSFIRIYSLYTPISNRWLLG